MAEFLIKVHDNLHTDPVKDTRGCYKAGDIVVVMPDGHAWGKDEGLPLFYIVKVPGLSHTRVQALIDKEPDFLNPGQFFRRRKWQVDLAALPLQVLNTLNSTGVYSTTVTAVKNYIKEKSTGNLFSGY